MKEIKNIIFDFGGVLLDLDVRGCVDAFAALGFDASPYVGTYGQGGVFEQHELGLITTEQFLDSIDCPATREAKRAAWESMLVDVPLRRREAVLRLRKKYRTFMLSNTNEVHWQQSLEHWWNVDGRTTADYFERIFLSCEMHMRKPSADIFATALAEAGLDPEETLFIDDSQRNCDTAASLGMHTLCATGDEWMQCTATVGHFDGVHLGHRYLIDRVKEVAGAQWSMLITFDRHPREVVAPQSVPGALTTLDDKLQLLHDTGVDEVAVLHFDEQMAAMSSRAFLYYIREQYAVRTLLVGHDHHFGHNAKGETIDDYRRYGREVGIDVVAVDAMPGESVSSSDVRRALTEGDVERAAALLGRPYALTGCVVEGRQVGRQIGFPTANLDVRHQLLPARGVYAARVEGRRAVLNIGSRPTLDDGAVTVEVHIPHFDGNLYGRQLRVELLRRLRGEQHFSSLDELKEQIARDVAAAMQ